MLALGVILPVHIMLLLLEGLAFAAHDRLEAAVADLLCRTVLSDKSIPPIARTAIGHTVIQPYGHEAFFSIRLTTGHES